LRTENGFSPDIHCDEEFEVQQGLRDTIEATDGLIGG
jgi:hypothetical protein